MTIERVYLLEIYGHHWRLRRPENKTGTARGTRERMLAMAAANGWTVKDELPPLVADPLDPAERIPLSPEEQARAGASIDRFRERTGR